MKIHYHDRSELPAEIAVDAVYHKDPSDLLRVSQFLSLHAPETPQTRHFLNSKAISLLPRGAIVVNTARGGLVSTTTSSLLSRAGGLPLPDSTYLKESQNFTRNMFR
jgi:lactate dehydrogenase-like 2-hydroxyacid dehydrogenase